MSKILLEEKEQQQKLIDAFNGIGYEIDKTIFVQKALAEGNKVDKFCLASEEDVWRYLKTKLTSLPTKLLSM